MRQVVFLRLLSFVFQNFYRKLRRFYNGQHINEIHRKHSLAHFRRAAGLGLLFHRRTPVLHYHYWNPFRLPIMEVRSILLMAVRDRGRGRKQCRRLSQHIHEYTLDSARLVGNRSCAPCLRTYLLHNHHRNPIRITALQDCPSLPDTIWQDLPVVTVKSR